MTELDQTENHPTGNLASFHSTVVLLHVLSPHTREASCGEEHFQQDQTGATPASTQGQIERLSLSCRGAAEPGGRQKHLTCLGRATEVQGLHHESPHRQPGYTWEASILDTQPEQGPGHHNTVGQPPQKPIRCQTVPPEKLRKNSWVCQRRVSALYALPSRGCCPLGKEVGFWNSLNFFMQQGYIGEETVDLES